MDVCDFSTKYAALVDTVVNGFVVVAAFASGSVFDAPFMHQMSTLSM